VNLKVPIELTSEIVPLTVTLPPILPVPTKRKTDADDGRSPRRSTAQLRGLFSGAGAGAFGIKQMTPGWPQERRAQA
jgi:hypothetical protein